MCSPSPSINASTPKSATISLAAARKSEAIFMTTAAKLVAVIISAGLFIRPAQGLLSILNSLLIGVSQFILTVYPEQDARSQYDPGIHPCYPAMALAVIALVGLPMILDYLILGKALANRVRASMEKTSARLGVTISVEEVSASALSGHITIHGVTLGNVEGFGPGPMLRVGNIQCQVSQPLVLLRKRWRDTRINLDTVAIDSVDILLEAKRTPVWSSNLGEALLKMQRLRAVNAVSNKGSLMSRLNVSAVGLRNMRLEYSLGVGMNVRVPLGDVSCTFGSLSADEILGELFRAVLRGTAESFSEAAWDCCGGSVLERLADGMGGAFVGLRSSVQDALSATGAEALAGMSGEGLLTGLYSWAFAEDDAEQGLEPESEVGFVSPASMSQPDSGVEDDCLPWTADGLTECHLLMPPASDKEGASALWNVFVGYSAEDDAKSCASLSTAPGSAPETPVSLMKLPEENDWGEVLDDLFSDCDSCDVGSSHGNASDEPSSPLVPESNLETTASLTKTTGDSQPIEELTTATEISTTGLLTSRLGSIMDWYCQSSTESSSVATNSETPATELKDRSSSWDTFVAWTGLDQQKCGDSQSEPSDACRNASDDEPQDDGGAYQMWEGW